MTNRRTIGPRSGSEVSLRGLVREASGSLRGQKVAFAMVCLLVAAMCVTVVITTGRAAAAADRVTARVEAAGSRQLIVSETTGGPLVAPAAVDVLGRVSTVQAVVGLGTARDVTNGAVGAGGTPPPAWPVLGDLPAVVDLSSGRWPRPGEALVSSRGQRLLGLDEPVGWVSDNRGAQYPVVGGYRIRPGFDDLDGVLIVQQGGTTPTLRLLVTEAAAAAATQRLTMSVLDPPDPSRVRITSPTALAALQQAVGGELNSYTRALTIITVGAATVLIAIVVLSQVLLQRRDLGRRRALGAPRWAVIALVVGQTTVPAAVGAVGGTGVTLMVTTSTGGAPSLGLAAATVIIGVLAAAVAGLLPAVLAAWRDPVRVLRTP